jgi:hypothetical protein
MRTAIASILLAALAFPAVAAEPSIADQAHDAYAVFAGGMSQQAFLGAQFGRYALDGVAGNWVRLNGPDPKAGIETYGVDTARNCKTQAALTLASPSSLVLTLTTNLRGSNFTQQYSLIAGSTFGEHTDPGPYLDAIGLGPEHAGDQADQQRALLLSLANGLIQIYRPSADILVMTRDRGYPIVLARCPVDAPSPPAAPTADASSSSTPATTD